MNIELQKPAAGRVESLSLRINGNPFSMRFDTRKPTQRYIYESLRAGKFYEPEATSAIVDTLKPGDFFFDVGANCGWFSALAAACGARVVAFEPEHEDFAALVWNVPTATLIQAAVSDNDEGATLYVNLDNDGGHALWPCGTHPHNTETAKTNPKIEVVSVLLDYFAACLPVAIKIDTEGAECNVLLGAQKVLANPSLRLVVCERHEMGLRLLGHSSEEVEAIMAGYGFKWEPLNPNLDVVQNWIFTR